MKKLNLVFIKNLLNICIISFLFFGCATNTNVVIDYDSLLKVEKNIPQEITLTFTGDLMAHTNVTRMKDFSIIYEDILDIMKNDDLTFTNLETPVVNNLDYENFPNFNVKNPFPLAAINAGIEVFSLTNNHTNDQGLEGIKSTRKFFEDYNNSQVDESKKVYFAGIKEKSGGDFTYQVIEKNGFKIIFMAFTEIFNTPSYRSWFDTQGTTDENRKNLYKKITELKKQHSADIFVLSVHCEEPEYVRTVTKKRKDFYHNLLDAGVDILWANHPHVTQEWEVVKSDKTPYKTKYIMYSVGNFVSGQRYRRNYQDPESAREYTGESFLFQIKFVKNDKIIYSDTINPILITNHTDIYGNTFIKVLNQDFIDGLKTQDKKYYQKRLELMNQIEGKTIWQ